MHVAQQAQVLINPLTELTYTDNSANDGCVLCLLRCCRLPERLQWASQTSAIVLPWPSRGKYFSVIYAVCYVFVPLCSSGTSPEPTLPQVPRLHEYISDL